MDRRRPSANRSGSSAASEVYRRQGKEQAAGLLMRALQNARTFLHAGVTTARENGAKNKVGFSLKEGIQRGLSEGPEMVVSGRPITITGGHFWYCGSEADGVEGVRAAVRKLIKEGAEFIKIMATGGSTMTLRHN